MSCAGGDSASSCDRHRALDRGSDLVHHLGDEALVVPFSHDTNHGLCTRRADDEPAGIAEPQPYGLHGVLHALVLERISAMIPDAFQQLRHGLEALADFTNGLSALNDDAQDLKRR